MVQINYDLRGLRGVERAFKWRRRAWQRERSELMRKVQRLMLRKVRKEAPGKLGKGYRAKIQIRKEHVSVEPVNKKVRKIAGYVIRGVRKGYPINVKNAQVLAKQSTHGIRIKRGRNSGRFIFPTNTGRRSGVYTGWLTFGKRVWHPRRPGNRFLERALKEARPFIRQYVQTAIRKAVRLRGRRR